ncbi:VOC family protein [Paraburkholderia tropica]|uniref:VOC family protein n=1 Tax=Paraburkholderia tropica TaxID=92647 RepID=UPI002AB0A624|nr:VOC family protein [Paraburkholderia tropica]
MLSYIMLGSNDIPASDKFYTALLAPLGYEKAELGADKVVFSLPDVPDRYNGPGAVYIAKPFNGEAATVGNGSMTAFRTTSKEKVEELHAAGLLAGGTDDGGPGFRDIYGDDFYVAYLRDPLGNKVALFCTLNR